MKRTKYKTKNIMILILIIFIIIIISISMLIKSKKTLFKDDLIFFKIFNQTQNKSIENQEKVNLEEIYFNNFNYNNESKNYKQYIMNVSYKDIDLKNINLIETIDNKTLLNEKIAPGTKGEFEIIIKANQKLKYQIKFESKNEKPQNLIFHIKGINKNYARLEDMEKDLKGETINKEEKIHINWEWKYNTNIQNDKQDTQDGVNIKKYNFNIYTIGEE